MMPETMTCIKINHGELNSATRPLPIPTAGEALIKVAAAGANRPDI
jgi:NADPH:quinone reductase-like Zn-dependent oxidoreductase